MVRPLAENFHCNESQGAPPNVDATSLARAQGNKITTAQQVKRPAGRQISQTTEDGYGLTFSAELLCGGSAQCSTHLEAKNSISAFLCFTFPVSSGITIRDCGPSATLKVHCNVCDCTPRCWQEFFSNAGSNIFGLPLS